MVEEDDPVALIDRAVIKLRLGEVAPELIKIQVKLPG